MSHPRTGHDAAPPPPPPPPHSLSHSPRHLLPSVGHRDTDIDSEKKEIRKEISNAVIGFISNTVIRLENPTTCVAVVLQLCCSCVAVVLHCVVATRGRKCCVENGLENPTTVLSNIVIGL